MTNETGKHITKIIFVYNEKTDTETIAKAYTQDDEHLAEQHAEDFKRSIFTDHETARIVSTAP